MINSKSECEKYFYIHSKKYFALKPSNLKQEKLKADYLNSYGLKKGIDFNKSLDCRLNKKIIENSLANTLQIIFEVTEKCNLSCEYCAYGDLYKEGSKRESKDMPLNYAIKLLDYLFKLMSSNKNKSVGKKTAFSFYGGEPLLNIKFISEVIKHVKASGIKSIIPMYTMTTNALLLKKNIDFLVENDFHILISLDGNKKNNSYRIYKNKKEAFNEIIENIDFVFSHYPKFFKNNVEFNSVLHNRNSVNEIFNFIHKKYNKKPTIGELNTSGIIEEKKEDFWNKYKNAIESLNQSEDYRFIREELFTSSPDINIVSRFIHNYTNNNYKIYKELFEIYDKNNYLPTGTCIPFSRKIFLTASGEILPCERISHDFSFGKINEKEVIINYEGEIVNKINKIYDILVNKFCSKCYNVDRCQQCIFNLDLSDTNKIKCSGFTNKNNDKIINYCINLLKKDRKLYSKILKEIYYE